MWFRWSCSNTCFLNDSGITTSLPLSVTPSINTISSQNVQYVLMSCPICSLFSGQPLMMYLLAVVDDHLVRLPAVIAVLSCNLGCLSLSVWCPYSIAWQVFLHLCFFLWFWLESQSAINRSSSGLYMILTLYWCILRRIHCIICDSIMASFLKIATSGL